MIGLSLAPLLLAAAMAGDCPRSGGDPAAALVVARLNAERLAAGASPLRPAAVPCRVAAERAASRSAGREEDDAVTMMALHRRLRAGGYETHRWKEQTVSGTGGALAVLGRWRRQAPAEWAALVEGDFADVGVGVAGGAEESVVTLLVALPRIVWLRRQAGPLLDAPATAAAVLGAANALRAEHERAPLRADPRLAAAAQAHAGDMLARDYYGHRSPEGNSPRSRAVEAGYRPARIAENAAQGLFGPAEVVERWALSSSHRRNLLDRGVADAGVGVAVGERGDEVVVYWVMLLARP